MALGRLDLQNESAASEQGCFWFFFPWWWVLFGVWLVVVVFLVMDCDLDLTVSSALFMGLLPFLHK